MKKKEMKMLQTLERRENIIDKKLSLELTLFVIYIHTLRTCSIASEKVKVPS